MIERIGNRCFYRPSKEVYSSPEEFGLSPHSVFFNGRGPQLHGWFFRAEGEPKGTVVHCHGNSGNITGHYERVQWLPEAGFNVFCFDYRGYGLSQGSPTRAGTIEDLHSAIDYVRGLDGVDPCRILLFGQSLGASVGIVAASTRSDLRGVAAEGAFSSYRRVARFVCKQSILLFPLTPLVNLCLVSKGYDPIDYVDRLAPTPLLLITGTADHTCDYRQTLDLHEQAGEPKSLWVVQGGGHVTALTDSEGEGRRKLLDFFHDCLHTPH